MKEREAILWIGIVLWALGILVGGSVAQLLPGTASSLSPAVVLIVALVATVANLVFLFKKVQTVGS